MENEIRQSGSDYLTGPICLRGQGLRQGSSKVRSREMEQWVLGQILYASPPLHAAMTGLYSTPPPPIMKPPSPVLYCKRFVAFRCLSIRNVPCGFL